MKTKLLSAILLVCLLISNYGFAKDKVKRSLNFCLETFMSTLQTGYHQDYSSIIAENAKFNTNRSGKVVTHSKSDELKFYSKNGKQAAIQNCEITHDVITETENYALVNVKMKYPDFTRSNIVTLAKINDSWKITEVNSVFK
jgi:hypothetical protein